MKVSENWLRELVDIPATRAELVERLTLSGLEVESVTELGAGLDGVVVARIVSTAPHPDADRLQVCEVDAGGDRLRVVCGAANARPGLVAPLATIGTRMPSGTLIAAARLRGVESQGMLCSALELGLDSDASGLLELPDEASPGTPLAVALGLPDAVIELGLTPNRADCLGMRGIALEVAAEFGAAVALPAIDPVPSAIADAIAVRLEAPADCPRYCGRLVRGIDPRAPSPAWLAERLRRAGIRPISALVDVTNYVMLETGQPLHAFDARCIEGDVAVRRARAGESLTLLDEREIALDADFLVIADARGPLALAGVMGGHASRVTDATSDVFLEAAHFSPAAINGRARRLGLHTDAAHRFERGVDPASPSLALERATALLVGIAGGTPGPVVEAVSEEHLPQRRPVRLRRERLTRILGLEVPPHEVARTLIGLGMDLATDAEGWLATPPGARFDIAAEEDLIEEVARIHGYGAIPAQSPRGESSMPVLREDRVGIAALRAQLVARDFHEAISYAFVARGLLETWGLEDATIALANPLSADLAVMRTSLLPGLVAALESNRNRQQSRVRLFEVGRSYHAGPDGPVETARIAGVACGPAATEQWGEPRRDLDFFDIKGDVESLLALTGAGAGEFAFEAGGPAWLHAGRCATVRRAGDVVGQVGALAPRLQNALGLDGDVYVFELDIDVLSERRVPVSRPLSRFPSLRRDIAMLLPESVAWAEVEGCVRKAVGANLARLVLFDRYVGPNLETGTKSLAMGLILQDRSRTLTDQDADRCVALAVAALERECKGRLRG